MIGRDYGTQVEITAGLQGWEYIIVNPGDEVREGVLVTPRAAPESEEKKLEGSKRQRRFFNYRSASNKHLFVQRR
jgi:hypothetical protein